MQVLVTGANGHIGSHIVRAARDAGMTPVAFVRPAADRRALLGLDVEVREGDVLDADGLARACRGIDVLFHAAAVYRNFAVNPEDIIRPAVLGTKNALLAARSAGVGRVVYTSTAATIGFTADPSHALDEDYTLTAAHNPYAQGKIAAEKLALEAAKAGLDVVVLNPSGVFGPRDFRLTPSTRGLKSVLEGDPLFFHLCPTDVRDVGRAHVLAAEKGVSGRRYIVTGAAMAPKQIRDALARLTSIAPATFQPPRFLARFIAGRMEKRAAATGGDAALTRAMVEDNLGRHLVYDASRIMGELGARFRPGEEVLKDTVRWLLFTDALGAKVAAKIKRHMGASAAPDPDWRTA